MIRDQVLISAGFIVAFAGFMLGYAIAWRQRAKWDGSRQ